MEILRRGENLVALAVVLHVFGAGIERNLHHLVLALRRGVDDYLPFLLNIQATEPDSPRLPLFFEKRWRNSETVRLRLSVVALTITAACPARSLRK